MMAYFHKEDYDCDYGLCSVYAHSQALAMQTVK